MVAALAACAPSPAPPPSEPLAVNEEISWPEECKDWDEWDKPAQPFRIYGNAWYVGTCGISAILVASDDGLILIDGGPANAAPLIARNIEALGFKLSEVKLLLHSHEHHDHVGGLAELQRRTGARLLASPEAAPVLASGTAGPADPQYTLHDTFPAARIDGTVENGEVVRLGDLTLAPIATPGHTPGALSWQWRSCEHEACLTMVYADSLSAVSGDEYRFGDHASYLASFRTSIARIAQLDCDILLTPHPSASGMRERLIEDDLTDRAACKTYAEILGQRLDARLAEEATGR